MQHKFPMKIGSLRFAAAACSFAFLFAGHGMASVITFAQFVQTNGSTQEWSVATSGTTTTITVSGSVNFSFSGVSGLPFSGPESANFTLIATSSQPGTCGTCLTGTSFVQNGYSGSFSFTDTGSAPGTNLLSGVFAVTGTPSLTGAQFSSHIGSSGGSFDASATSSNLNQLVLSSAFLNFSNQTEEDASWSLSSLLPNFAIGTVTANQAYPAAGPFTAASSGTFSSNPGPTAAPEPGTLLLLGSGLFFVGRLAVRRRTALPVTRL